MTQHLTAEALRKDFLAVFGQDRMVVVDDGQD